MLPSGEEQPSRPAQDAGEKKEVEIVVIDSDSDSDSDDEISYMACARCVFVKPAFEFQEGLEARAYCRQCRANLNHMVWRIAQQRRQSIRRVMLLRESGAAHCAYCRRLPPQNHAQPSPPPASVPSSRTSLSSPSSSSRDSGCGTGALCHGCDMIIQYRAARLGATDTRLVSLCTDCHNRPRGNPQRPLCRGCLVRRRRGFSFWQRGRRYGDGSYNTAPRMSIDYILNK